MAQHGRPQWRDGWPTMVGQSRAIWRRGAGQCGGAACSRPWRQDLTRSDTTELAASFSLARAMARHSASVALALASKAAARAAGRMMMPLVTVNGANITRAVTTQVLSAVKPPTT